MAERQRARNSDTVRMCGGMVGAQKIGVNTWPEKGGEVSAKKAATMLVECVETALKWVAGEEVDIEATITTALEELQAPLIPKK